MFNNLRHLLGTAAASHAWPSLFVNTEAGIFAPTLFEGVDVPVKARNPSQSGRCIDDTAKRQLARFSLTRGLS